MSSPRCESVPKILPLIGEQTLHGRSHDQGLPHTLENISPVGVTYRITRMVPQGPGGGHGSEEF